VDFCKDVPSAVKIATFHTPGTQALLEVKFLQMFGLGNFLLDLALTLEVQRENTPYSSSEPNESGILNRQSGGKKLKYILKFYIGGTCHVK